MDFMCARKTSASGTASRLKRSRRTAVRASWNPRARFQVRTRGPAEPATTAAAWDMGPPLMIRTQGLSRQSRRFPRKFFRRKRVAGLSSCRPAPLLETRCRQAGWAHTIGVLDGEEDLAMDT